jgi:hypothetical protein
LKTHRIEEKGYMSKVFIEKRTTCRLCVDEIAEQSDSCCERERSCIQYLRCWCSKNTRL